MASKADDGLTEVRNKTGRQREQVEGVEQGDSELPFPRSSLPVRDEARATQWLPTSTSMSENLSTWLSSLFPFLHWIGRYNIQWFAGDLVAGITIGAVVVPQGMAYAILAGLEPQFGLYSSFMGVLVYWFFATSKDITIGPVAVVSVLVGQIVEAARETHQDIPAHVIASALGFVAGAIIVLIGLARLGWVVDLIPLVSISSFMTGSAITIASGQLPNLFGIKGFNTREAPYWVIKNTLRGLPRMRWDAIMGLSALFTLYSIRSICTYTARKHPHKQQILFFASTLRTVFVILLFTIISWLVNRNHRDQPLFSILRDVPSGFQNLGVPVINSEILSTFASDIPATVMVLLLEHVAIAKSFGRINNYVINPSQEMVAIGVSNILGPFLGGYPATGSFSRTAIKSKAGVRTPFAGVITAVVVFMAIYALPTAFYYIPNASLSAVIIHAVLDLIISPGTIYQYWRISPLEIPIFFAGLLVTIFSSIEDGIYTTIIASFSLLLLRLTYTNRGFLGKLPIRPYQSSSAITESTPFISTLSVTRNQFVSRQRQPDTRPLLPPGIVFHRFSTNNLLYLNSSRHLLELTSQIFSITRRTKVQNYSRPGDRPWNDTTPSHGKQTADSYEERSVVKAVILDFSSIEGVDLTSVQELIDVKVEVERYASPRQVAWLFVGVDEGLGVKRALVAGGFRTYHVEIEKGTNQDNRKGTVDNSNLEVADIESEKENDIGNLIDDKDATLFASTQLSPHQTSLPPSQPRLNQISSSSNSRSPSSTSLIDQQEKERRGRSRKFDYGTVNHVENSRYPLFHADMTSALKYATLITDAIEESTTMEEVAEEV